MKYKYKKVYLDFISKIDSDKIDKRSFLLAIFEWTIKQSYRIDDKLLNEYGINSYLKLNIDDYPVEFSEVIPEEEIRSIKLNPPSHIDTFIAIIGDLIWELISFRINIMCPKCENYKMKVLCETKEEACTILYSCDICTWTQFPDGSDWNGNSILNAATKIQLKKEGYI